MGDVVSLRAELPHPFLSRDQRLMRRAARGDEGAFAAIFERYHQDLYRYCHSILRDADDAQDALQSTMASALRALPGEEREIALRPWLFRVAHNHAISIVRNRRETNGQDEVARLPDPRGAELPEARMRLRQLLSDLAALPEGARAALTMRELSGLSYGEIGQALEISVQAARQKVYEARLALLELEEGREMQCDSVREKIADGDRRALRARRVRAHLSDCTGCRDFLAAIDQRSADLAALSPPLPAFAAAAILNGLLGGGAAGAGIGAGAGAAGSAAGLAANGAGASLVIKGATTLAAATALGVGAAGYSGLVDVPLIGGGPSPSGVARPAQGPPPVATPTGESASGAPGAGMRRDGAGARRGDGSSKHHGNGGKPGNAGSPAAGSKPGPPAHAAQPGPPAQANAPGAPPPTSQAPAPTPGPPAHSSAPDEAAANGAASSGAEHGSPSGPSANASPQAQEAVAGAGAEAQGGSRAELDE